MWKMWACLKIVWVFVCLTISDVTGDTSEGCTIQTLTCIISDITGDTSGGCTIQTLTHQEAVQYRLWPTPSVMLLVTHQEAVQKRFWPSPHQDDEEHAEENISHVADHIVEGSQVSDGVCAVKVVVTQIFIPCPQQGLFEDTHYTGTCTLAVLAK